MFNDTIINDDGTFTMPERLFKGIKIISAILDAAKQVQGTFEDLQTGDFDDGSNTTADPCGLQNKANQFQGEPHFSLYCSGAKSDCALPLTTVKKLPQLSYAPWSQA